MAYTGLARGSSLKSGRTIQPPPAAAFGPGALREWGPFVRDMSGLWVLPDHRRAVTSLSGATMGAPGYEYPTKVDWANGLSQSLTQLDQPTKDYLGQKSECMAYGIDMMRTIFVEVAGMDPGAWVAIETGFKIADLVWGLANNVMGIGSVVGDVAGAVTDAIDSIGGSIPLLGMFVDLVMGIWGIVDKLNKQEAAERQAARRKAQERNVEKCTNWISTLGRESVEGTGAEGTASPTPSDIFREIAIRGPGASRLPYDRNLYGSINTGLPYNLGSMYVMLCAPEAQGYGPNRDFYDAKKMGMHNRIPKATKRKMWSLIKGIMAAAVAPGWRPVVNAVTTDHGKSLMPYLQEIVRREGPGPDGNGHWNEQTAAQYSMLLGEYCSATRCVDDECQDHSMWCEEMLKPESKLAHKFVQSMKDWQNKLAFQINPQWREKAAELNKHGAKTGIRALLTEAGTERMVAAAAGTEAALAAGAAEEAARSKRLRSIARGAAGVTGSAAAAYIAWTLMRKFGPKKRGR